MKTKASIIILGIVLFASCTHPDLAGFHYGGGEIAFFQFTDTNLIKKAIICFDTPAPLKPEFVHSWGETCWVPLYPKNLEGQPIFGKDGYLGTNHLLNWKVGDIYTLEDIIKSLISPKLDPRDEMPQPLLKSDILDIKDLKRGMKLQGTVRNVVDFGVFIDIGLHNDGLAHISKLTNKYIKHPSEVVQVGDIVDCFVDDINIEKEKVNLSLIDPNK